MMRCPLSLLALLLPSLAAAWPTLAVPSGARVESLGEQVRLNGVPMHMQRVLSGQSPQALVAFYRTALGPRHAEQALPDSLVLSQDRDGFFITVRVRPLGAKTTEVLVSASDLQAAKRLGPRPLGFVLPADTQLLSDMESVDAGKQSRQLVASNRLSLEGNLQALNDTLAERGYVPEGPPASRTDAALVQRYSGAQREAQLTLVRQHNQTQMVLTTIVTP
jgi:hypothetical protein